MAQAFNLTAQLNLRGPTNVNAVVTNIRRQLGNISANVTINVNPSTANNIAQLNTRLAALNTTLRTTTTRATSASQAIRQLGQAFSSVHIGNIPAQINAAATAIGNLHRANANVHRGLAQTSTEMEEFGRQAGLAIRRFSAFSTVSGVIFGLTNAITQGLKAFIEYDREIVKLQQVTGESAAGLAGLGKTISGLATSLGVSSSELTSVASTLAQAGLSARDTEKALKALALSSLAPSFDDMNKTVEGSIALMRQFGISAGDLDKALGSINAVAAKFAVEASDIVTAIQRTGGVFATASKGVSEGTDALNEFMAIFTSVRATTRESAETIATGLRTIFTRVQRGSTIEALKEYGVNLQDLDGKFVGAYKAVELLSKGLSSIDPRDMKFSQIVEELGGFRQIGKVIPLIQQFTTTQEALKVAQQGQGSLAKDAATAQLSLANQIAKVREEFLTLFRTIGSSDTFQVMIKGALNLSLAFIKIADSIKGILPALAIFAAFKGASAATQFIGGFAGAVRGGQRRAEGGPIRRFASGGFVPGSGDGDTVPARLTPGEFVIRKKAVQAIGVDNLHQMNRYADGGSVRSSKNTGNVSRGNRYFDGGTVKELMSKTKGGSTIANYQKNNSDIIHDGDKVKSDRDSIKYRLTDDDKRELFNSTLNTSGGRNRFVKGGMKRYNKVEWADAFESIIAKKEGYSKTSDDQQYGPSFAQDLVKTINGEKQFAEVKFTKNPVSLDHLVSKKLRTILTTKPRVPGENSWGFTKKRKDENDLGPIKVFELAEGEKEKFTNEYKAKKFDPKYNPKRLNTGGLVQKFAAGDVVKRSIGYLDSDVLADPENSAIVGPEMERLQLKKISEYKMYLSQLAIGSRKKGDLSKFTSLVGVAGAGKSSLVQGRGTDSGRLRQTSRFPILTAQDISRATEVLDITSTVTPEKLGAYLTQSDKIIALSSSTKEEMQEIRRRRGERVITGKNLFGREPNSADRAPVDSGPLEAMLASEINPKKIITLGVKTGGGFNIKRDTGISVENTKIASFTGFVGPPQRGHESQMDISASLGFKPENFIAVVSGNEAIDSSDSDSHSYRSAVLDQDSRTILARAAFEARGGRVAKLPIDAGFKVPNILEIEGGKNGKRHFVRGLKGSVALSQGKRPDQTKKYTDAGFISHNIEERTGGFSGTQARQAILDGDIPAMQQILSPGVFALVSKNLSQIQNRANILPKIISKIEQNKQKSLAPIKQQLDAFPIQRVDNKKLAAEGPNSEYGRMVAQLRELRNSRDKIQNSGGFEPFSLIRKLEKRYPDRYRLNFGETSSGLQEGILRTATSAKVSKQADEPLSPESLSFLESTLPKIPTKVESSVLDQFFKGKSIPKDPSIYGEFAGKYVDQVTKKVNRDSYSSQLTPEKLAYYSATKDFLYKGLSADKIAEREGIISSVAKSTKVGVVGLQPADFASVKQPQMLGGENTTMFIQGLSSKYQKDVAKVRKTLKRTIGAFGSNLEKTSGVSKTPLREMREEEENASGMANVEGAVLEMVLSRLGAVGGTVQNRAIDYPNGLGARAAKFFPGIGPNWPTEVKRTLDYDALSDAKDEFIRYFSAKNGVSIEKKAEPVKMMAGGKVKEVFGSGETKFPTSTKTAYEKATMKRRVRERFPDMNPTDERVFVDSSKVEEKFDSPEPFDLEKFKTSFSGKVSRDSLITSLSDFAKFIGLPKDQLTKVLPTHLDFGGMRSAFHKMPTGSRGKEGFDLSSGWNEKDEQDLFGYERLLEKKQKEGDKIRKTSLKTFDDGSIRIDETAAEKNRNESNDIRTKIFELGEKKRNAENSVIKEKTDFAKQTGRGVITLGGDINRRPSNHVLYHELTHQLFNGLSAGSSDVFAKYSQRVNSLFDGDNNQLAEAFDALGEYEYKSADVVYGRSYKSSRLIDIIREKASKREKGGVAGVAYDPKEFDEAVILRGKADAANKAMQFKPLNPNVNKILLANNTSQEVINAYEDSGKQEFLTTLVQKLPTLDSHLQSILNSTIESLLGDAGIKRQKFATGGSAEDTVSALLTPGEFVINKKAANRIGLGNLHKLNHADKISGFNKGGPVGGVQRFLTGGNVQTETDTLTANSPRATQNGFLPRFGGLDRSLMATNAQFTALATTLTTVGGELGAFTTLQAAAGDKSLAQIKRAIRASIDATAAQGNMATQTEGLRRVLDQVVNVEQSAIASVRETVAARRRSTLGGRLREGLQGQGGFYASQAIGALSGQGENIFGKRTTSAQTAQNVAGFEAATSTTATGFALASQSLAIPIVGPAIATIVTAGTVISAWNNSIEAGEKALQQFNTDLKNKKIQDATEKLSTAFNNFAKDMSGFNFLELIKQQTNTNNQIESGINQDIVNQQATKREKAVSNTGMIDFLFNKQGEWNPLFREDKNRRVNIGPKTSADYLEVAKESSKAYDPTPAMMVFENMLKKGQISLKEFATSTDRSISVFRDAIAKSKPEVFAKYMELMDRAKINTEKGNIAQAEANKLEAQNIIISSTLNNVGLQGMEITNKFNKTIEMANNAGRRLSISFGRLVDSLNQALNKTIYSLSKMDDAVDGMVQSLSGKAKIQNVKSDAANVLSNPKAYTDKQVNTAVNQAIKMIPPGRDSDTVKGILDLDRTLERVTVGALRSKVGTKTNADLSDVLKEVRTAGIADIESKNLPKDITDKLIESFKGKLLELEGNIPKGTEGATAPQENVNILDSKLREISKLTTEEANKQLQEIAKQFAEFNTGVFNKYIDSVNIATEKQIEASQGYDKAKDIMSDGASALRTSLTGVSVDLNSIINKNVDQTTRKTGGIFDPTQIKQNFLGLEDQRVKQQKLVDDAIQTRNVDEFLKNSAALASTTAKLQENKSALEDLANSTNIATAAMSKIAEIEKLKQENLSFAEKMATASPQDLQKMNIATMQINNNLRGGLNRSTPEQRAQSLDLLKALAPMLKAQYAQQYINNGIEKDPRKAAELAEANFNKGYGIILDRMSIEAGGPRGLGNIGFNSMQKAAGNLINPTGDPEMQKAMTVYNTAIGVQSQANTELAKLNDILSKNILGEALDRMTAAFAGFAPNFNQARENDRRIEAGQVNVQGANVNVNVGNGGPPAVAPPVAAKKANGGLIYASTGKLINFQPQGTDTVPAMLTPGEFVVNAQSTAQHLPLLKAINKQKGGVVYLAGGSSDPVKSGMDVAKSASSVGKDIVSGNINTGTASSALDFVKSTADIAGSVPALKEFGGIGADLLGIGSSVGTIMSAESSIADKTKAAASAAKDTAGLVSTIGSAKTIAPEQTFKALGPAAGKIATIGGAAIELGMGAYKGYNDKEAIQNGIPATGRLGLGAISGSASSGGSLTANTLGIQNDQKTDEQWAQREATGRGAAIGGSIGSVVPVVGTAIGAGVGAAVGFASETIKVGAEALAMHKDNQNGRISQNISKLEGSLEASRTNQRIAQNNPEAQNSGLMSMLGEIQNNDKKSNTSSDIAVGSWSEGGLVYLAGGGRVKRSNPIEIERRRRKEEFERRQEANKARNAEAKKVPWMAALDKFSENYVSKQQRKIRESGNVYPEGGKTPITSSLAGRGVNGEMRGKDSLQRAREKFEQESGDITDRSALDRFDQKYDLTQEQYRHLLAYQESKITRRGQEQSERENAAKQKKIETNLAKAQKNPRMSNQILDKQGNIIANAIPSSVQMIATMPGSALDSATYPDGNPRPGAKIQWQLRQPDGSIITVSDEQLSGDQSSLFMNQINERRRIAKEEEKNRITSITTGQSFKVKDNTGKHTTVGTVESIDLDTQQVRILKENGKISTVPFDRLSEQSRQDINKTPAFQKAIEVQGRKNFERQQKQQKEEQAKADKIALEQRPTPIPQPKPSSGIIVHPRKPPEEKPTLTYKEKIELLDAQRRLSPKKPNEEYFSKLGTIGHAVGESVLNNPIINNPVVRGVGNALNLGRYGVQTALTAAVAGGAMVTKDVVLSENLQRVLTPIGFGFNAMELAPSLSAFANQTDRLAQASAIGVQENVVGFGGNLIQLAMGGDNPASDHAKKLTKQREELESKYKAEGNSSVASTGYDIANFVAPFLFDPLGAGAAVSGINKVGKAIRHNAFDTMKEGVRRGFNARELAEIAAAKASENAIIEAAKASENAQLAAQAAARGARIEARIVESAGGKTIATQAAETAAKIQAEETARAAKIAETAANKAAADKAAIVERNKKIASSRPQNPGVALPGGGYVTPNPENAKIAEQVSEQAAKETSRTTKIAQSKAASEAEKKALQKQIEQAIEAETPKPRNPIDLEPDPRTKQVLEERNAQRKNIEEVQSQERKAMTPEQKVKADAIAAERERNFQESVKTPIVDPNKVKEHLKGPMALPTGVEGEYRYNPGMTSQNEHGITGWKASLKASGSTPEEVIANNQAIEKWLMENHKAEFKPYSDEGGLFWRAETLGGSSKEMEDFASRASKDLGSVLDTSFKYVDDPTSEVLAKEFAPGIRARFDTMESVTPRPSPHIQKAYLEAHSGKLPEGVSVPWHSDPRGGAGPRILQNDQAISANWGSRIDAIKNKIKNTTDPSEISKLTEAVKAEEEKLSSVLGKNFPGVYKNKGGIIYASNGALISARNMGTDTVPAMLTPGEFVVNKDAASSHMSLLQSINRSKGGSVNYLANGGFVSPRYYSGGAAVGPTGTVKQNNNGGVSNGGSGSSVNQEILADFKSQFTEAVSTLGSHIDSFSQSASAFGGASETINNSVSRFGETADKIPAELNITGSLNTNMNVNHNGAQALASIEPSMKNYALGNIANSLNNLNTGLEGGLFQGDTNQIIGKNKGQGLA